MPYMLIQHPIDLTGTIADTCHKVRHLKKDWTPGAQNRFTVNMYRTQSSVLVNGPKVDLFVENILDPIEKMSQSKRDALSQKKRKKN